MLLVSELLAGGGQVPVNSAIPGFTKKEVPEAVLDDAVGLVAGTGAGGAGVDSIGVHPPHGVHIPFQEGVGPIGFIHQASQDT